MNMLEQALHALEISGYSYLKPVSRVRFGWIFAPVVKRTLLSFEKRYSTTNSGSGNRAGRHKALAKAFEKSRFVTTWGATPLRTPSTFGFSMEYLMRLQRSSM